MNIRQSDPAVLPKDNDSSLKNSTASINSELSWIRLVNAARALLIENLAIISTSQSNLESAIRIAGELDVSVGEKARLDFSNQRIVINTTQKDIEEGELAHLMLEGALAFSKYQLFGNTPSKQELKIIHTAAREEAQELLESTRDKDGRLFGKATEITREHFLSMIDEVLTPTEEELRMRRLKAGSWQSPNTESSDQVQIESNFVFLSRLLQMQRDQTTDRALAQQTWQIFGPRLDQIFSIADRETRNRTLEDAVKSISNIVAKEYLIYRKNIKSQGLVLLASESQLSTLADMVAEPLELYMVSRKRLGRSANTAHAQICTAVNSLSTSRDLPQYMRGTDSFLNRLRERLNRFDPNLASLPSSKGDHSSNAALLSAIPNATLLIAATPKGEAVAVPSAQGLLRIGFSGAQSEVQPHKDIKESQAETKARLNSLFDRELGYPSTLEIIGAIASAIRSCSRGEDLQKLSVNTVVESMKSLAVPDDKRVATLSDWFEYVLQIFDNSSEPNSRSGKTLRTQWAQKLKHSPEIEDSHIRMLNQAQRATHGDEAPQITKDQIARGLFTAYLLKGAISNDNESENLATTALKALDALYQRTEDYSLLLASTTLSLLLNDQGAPTLVEEAPISEKKSAGQSSWLPKMFSGSKKTDVAPDKENVNQSLDRSPPIHQGTQFEDLWTRIRQNGPELEMRLPTLRYDEQQREIRILLSGSDKQQLVEESFRNASRATHPDTRSGRFSNPACYEIASELFHSITALRDLSKNADEFVESDALNALRNLNEGYQKIVVIQEKAERAAQHADKEAARQSQDALIELLAEFKSFRSDDIPRLEKKLDEILSELRDNR
jgi:hypothetical protein